MTWTPTPTATLTPVPRLAELCDSFRVEYSFDNGQTFFWDDTISMILGTAQTVVHDAETETDVPLVVRFLATHTETGENLGAELNGGQITVMELSARRLVNPGDYTWKAYLFAEGVGERCVHRGNFSVYPSPDALTATVEVTAES